MMSVEFASKLPALRECFARYPVERAWVFGSCARGQERPDSDADFLVKYDYSKRLGFLVGGLWDELNRITGREIDLVSEGYLRPYAQETAAADMVLVYERQRDGEG